MHRMHRFLFHSDRRKGMDSKQKGKGPKLERRNAAKNIDYEPASYPLSLQSDEPLERRTRSLDILPLCDQTSFRIEGNDGQFEDICRMLGLSGPDDFAIPSAAWEARKVRSSSALLPRSRLQLDGVKVDIPPPQPVDGGASEISERLESVGVNVLAQGQNEYVDSNDCCSTSYGHDFELSDMLRDSVRITDANHNQNDAAAETNESPALETSRGVGIRGARPPVLAPPPVFSRPVIDNAGSTWDIVRSFAPDSDRGSAFVIRGGFTYPDDAEADEGIATEVDVNRDRLEEIPVPSESCSFTTSNDDDSSSTTTDPLSNLSSTGRLRFTITRWQKGELLGRGSFGSVYEGIDDHGFFFAVKEVSLLDQGDQGRQSILQLEQEIALLSQFEDENIVQYYGTEKNDSKLYIFLELVTKGSLLSLYQKYNLRDSQVSAYTRQILRGLNYLHERDVVHRDIKCANILVDANGSVKLADFGLAKATKLNDVKSCKGTAFWMAPEVVKTEGYGLAADIWSLGCTVLEMLTRQLPYSHLECMQAIFRIGRGEPPPVPDSLSTDARDFIHTCLQVNPNARPTAAQLLDHPFVKRPLTSYAGAASPYHPGRRI